MKDITFIACLAFFIILFLTKIVMNIDKRDSSVENDNEESEVIGTHKNDKYGFKFWADPETGCEYIMKETYDSAAITPRMETSGKIKGC